MTDKTADAPKRGALSALAVYFERRSLVMLALGFASGLPFLLIFDTLSAWLREAGLSLSVIGFFSLATLAYAFKFIWAPLVDRTAIPGLTALFGHRRSWMLVCQAAIILGLWAISAGDPAANLGLMAALAVGVGFAGATQDIVMDAWRIEAVDESRQGAMAAAYQWGYRVAMILAGALPLLLAEEYSWNFSYAVMAGLVGIGVAGVLFAPREKAHAIRPIPTDDVSQPLPLAVAEWLVRLAILCFGALWLGSGLSGDAKLVANLLPAAQAEALTTAWTKPPWGVWLQLCGVLVGFVFIVLAALPLPGKPTKPGVYLGTAFGQPLADFFRRFAGSAGLILALICLYRVSDFVLNIMNPFYLDLGFTKTELAEVRKVFGVLATVIGVGAGGFLVARFGLMRALVVGAFAGPLSNLIFAWLATQGPSLPALFVAIGVDNVSGGIAGTALIAYMSSLTAEGFTASQYAFFSSLYALPGKLIASQSGRIVEASARSAEAGGTMAGLKAPFAGLPAGSLAEGAAKISVAPASLGAGYLAFFLYSSLIGVAAVVLTFVLVGRNRKAAPAVVD
jgi:PAT family beta-lactamase induction signal transducer AmpG